MSSAENDKEKEREREKAAKAKRNRRRRKGEEEEEVEIPFIEEKEWELLTEPLINVLTFGWQEDGRLGYPVDQESYMQMHPRPVSGWKDAWGDPTKPRSSSYKQFVCKKVVAGAKHTLFLMVNCRAEKDRGPRKSKKVMLCGLNQLGLCEEPGHVTPVDIDWEDELDEPVDIAAGNGTCFVVSSLGRVFSFGQGRYGVLGHGVNNASTPVPKPTSCLLPGIKVAQIAAGDYHTAVIATTGQVYTWGKNDIGQLGRGFESDFELQAGPVEALRPEIEIPIQISCGAMHTLLLVDTKKPDGGVNRGVWAWGDNARGQLGSGDTRMRHTPQENRWLARYIRKYNYSILDIAAGGFFNMVRTDSPFYVITWGGGEYGQLGRENAWDDPRPSNIVNLTHVMKISAGRRHCIAMRQKDGRTDIMGWGYNGYGELGIGDCDLRLTPALITAIPRCYPLDITAGDRHSAILISHKPVVAAEEPHLKPYFDIINEGVSSVVKKHLKQDAKRKGIDPFLLDDPLLVLPGQAGSEEKTLLNEKFEPGLRYCMDTYIDPSDWRRKGVETCFRVPSLKLGAICMTCSRFCHKGKRLDIFVRYRGSNDICECARTKWCICSWSTIRNEFDKQCGLDGCVGPNKIRDVLQALRGPAPIDSAEVEECLIVLTDGDSEEREEPRVSALVFERWYKEFYAVSPLEVETGYADGRVVRVYREEEDDGGRLKETGKKGAKK